MRQLQTLVQINHYPENLKKWGLRILKIGISIFCFYFIFEHTDLNRFPGEKVDWETPALLGLSIVFILSLANWGLEAERWRASLSGEDLTFYQALQGVLSGLAMNWVIPFTLGDAGGRLAPLKNKKRSAWALLLTRTVMLLITSLYGGIAVLYYLDKLNVWTLPMIISMSLVAFTITLRGGRFLQLSPEGSLKVVLVSMIRYFVFSFQFYLLIRLCIPSAPWELVWMGIGWVFLFRSLVPSLFGNFGVREASALFFFDAFLPNPELILIPCLLIWIINTVLPSILGALFILKLRINIAQ